ncbi:MAG: alpha/beta hydrolase [Chromatiales bacterium]|nr:MAG: alpha/beta hydrolase [Chromatiales bacterium]
MTVRKRIVVGVLLLVVVAGGWLYYALFMSPNSALQRAEAFLFRRMTVAQLGEQGVYRYFVATNRRVQSPDAPLASIFSNERTETLSFGVFDAEVEPTLGLGMLLNATDWFQNEEIRLRRPRQLERQDFVSGLRDQVARSPHNAVLVVVHGFREQFPSALRKTAFVGHVLDINAPIVAFDWPGNQGSTPRGYRRAHALAAQSGAELAKLLQLVVTDVQPARLWVLANSMGAEVVTNAFDVLYQQAEWADPDTEIEEVVLTAPDVGADDFNARFKPRIAALADTLTVYVSSNDRALVMSRIVNRGERRAGESTLSPDLLAEAERVLALTGPGEDQIVLVDVTPVNRTRNFHNFSLETPEFFDDIFLRLVSEDLPQSRLLYRVQTEDGRVYWVLTRGR